MTVYIIEMLFFLKIGFLLKFCPFSLDFGIKTLVVGRACCISKNKPKNNFPVLEYIEKVRSHVPNRPYFQ